MRLYLSLNGYTIQDRSVHGLVGGSKEGKEGGWVGGEWKEFGGGDGVELYARCVLCHAVRCHIFVTVEGKELISPLICLLSAA